MITFPMDGHPDVELDPEHVEELLPEGTGCMVYLSEWQNRGAIDTYIKDFVTTLSVDEAKERLGR